jgi:hypothetical protein
MGMTDDTAGNGSEEVDVGVLAVEARTRTIEGRRKRVGGMGMGVSGWLASSVSSGVVLSRIEGEAGTFSASWSSSKSNILEKLRPTLGEATNNLANSPGVGVASVSPVVVNIIPFMADGGWALRLKAIAGYLAGAGVEGIGSSCDAGMRARMLCTSSKGVFSFFPVSLFRW